jgi:hypothetical protein
MEIFTLTTPLPATSTLRIADLDLNVRGSLIRIVLAEWAAGDWVANGREIIASYSGAQADTMFVQLNKANLSTISLHTRVMEQLRTDGKLVGVVSGAAP